MMDGNVSVRVFLTLEQTNFIKHESDRMINVSYAIILEIDISMCLVGCYCQLSDSVHRVHSFYFIRIQFQNILRTS